MANAARAVDGRRSQQQRRRTASRREFQVIEGRGSRSQRSAQLSPRFVSIARIFAVSIVLMAALSFVSLWMTAQTSSMLQGIQTLKADISQARAESAQLEIRQSSLTATDRIKKIARNKLGMSAPAQMSYLSISDGVLATDDEGDLSIYKSIEALDAAPLTSEGDLSLSKSITVAGMQDLELDEEEDSNDKKASASDKKNADGTQHDGDADDEQGGEAGNAATDEEDSASSESDDGDVEDEESGSASEEDDGVDSEEGAYTDDDASAESEIDG